MFIIDIVKTKTLTILLIVVSLVLIGVLDYFTTSEFSTSIFYLVPLCFFALHKKSDKVSIILLSLFATVIWSTCDFLTRNYTSELFPVWNALVRFFIFSLFSYILYILKMKEARIMSVNEELLTLNNEKNKLIGIAAHDLRNPIGAINSFANILKDEVNSDDKNIIEGLDIIKNLSEHSLEMLKNLLDVSVIESGKVNLKKKSQDYIE